MSGVHEASAVKRMTGTVVSGSAACRSVHGERPPRHRSGRSVDTMVDTLSARSFSTCSSYIRKKKPTPAQSSLVHEHNRQAHAKSPTLRTLSLTYRALTATAGHPKCKERRSKAGQRHDSGQAGRCHGRRARG